MKRITLIVPDMVTYTFGGHERRESSTEVTQEVILKMISKRSDYHEEYYYGDLERVKINIEDCCNEVQ